MKKIAALLLIAVVGCATAPHSKPAHVFKDSGGPTYGQIDMMESAGRVAPVGITRITRKGGQLVQSTDGAAFAALGGGGFGSDTTISLPNASAQQVTALELINSLTNNVAGTEASQWVIKLLLAGAQSTSYVLDPVGLTVPVGSTTTPSINFAGDTTSGMYRQGSGDLRLIDRGTGVISWSNTGLLDLLTATCFHWSNSVGICQGGPNNANTILQPATTGNIEAGVAGVLATNATAGFFSVPTSAGAQTGVPANISTGKAPMEVDVTNDKACWFFAAAWHCTTLTP